MSAPGRGGERRARLLLVAGDGALTRTLSRTFEEARIDAQLEVVAKRPLGETLEATLHDSAGALDLVYVASARGDRLGLQPDLADAAAVFEAARAGDVRHLVVISSAAVHEPNAHHPQLLDEERAAPRWTGNPMPDAWCDLEELAQPGGSKEAPGTGLAVTVLRPSPVVTPGGEDFWSRWLLSTSLFAVSVPGYDPPLQLLAAADLGRAVAASLGRPPAPGAMRLFHVAPREAVPLRVALRRARKLRLPVPRRLQRPMRAASRRLRGPKSRVAPTWQLDALRFASSVSGERIERELGFAARRSSAEVAEGRRGRPGDGTDAEVDSRAHDPFGLDRAYHRRLSATLFRFLRSVWWRLEHRGLEHVPESGPAVLAGVHRGFQPWDGVMAMDLVARERGRYMRFLVHPTLVKHPFLTPYMQKLGGVPACGENACWVLGRGELMAIFPEGIRGAFRRYGKNVYRLGKFGRDEYVRFAVRHGAPIVPFVTVGTAEIFPVLGRFKWGWWQRAVEWPYFPITPTLGLVPLPSKWHLRFLEPVETDHLPAGAAEDPELVGELSREVRRRMQRALEDMLRRRRHVFWGSIFDDEESAESAATAGEVSAEKASLEKTAVEAKA